MPETGFYDGDRFQNLDTGRASVARRFLYNELKSFGYQPSRRAFLFFSEWLNIYLTGGTSKNLRGFKQL